MQGSHLGQSGQIFYASFMDLFMTRAFLLLCTCTLLSNCVVIAPIPIGTPGSASTNGANANETTSARDGANTDGTPSEEPPQLRRYQEDVVRETPSATPDTPTLSVYTPRPTLADAHVLNPNRGN